MTAAFVACAVSPFIGAFADEPESAAPAFAVKSVESAHPGDEVRVEIETKNNPGIVAFRYRVNYDREHFELVGANERDFIGVNFSPNEMDPFMVSWFDVSSGNNITNGVTAELVFKVKEGTPDAVYPIELSYYMQGDVCNFDLQEVTFELVNGSITVGEDSSETVTLPPPNDPPPESRGSAPRVTLPTERDRTPSVPDSIPQVDITFSELEERIKNNSGYDATTEGKSSSSSKGGKKKNNSSSGIEALPDPEDVLTSTDSSSDNTSTEADAPSEASSAVGSIGEPASIEKKSSAGLIAGIAAAVVVIATGAVIVIRRKKL